MTAIMVVTAGLGQPSSSRLLGDRLAAATVDRLRAADQRPEVEVVELREYAQDLAGHLVTGFPSPRLAALLDRVVRADALIAVTPVFSGSYSGLFKTFFDVLAPESLTGLPTLIAATGGTARHSLMLDHAMRPLFAYLRTVVVPTGVFAATEDFGAGGGPGRSLTDRIERAAAELAALLTPRGSVGRSGPAPAADEPETVVPFEQLLAGYRRG